MAFKVGDWVICIKQTQSYEWDVKPGWVGQIKDILPIQKFPYEDVIYFEDPPSQRPPASYKTSTLGFRAKYFEPLELTPLIKALYGIE